MSSEATASPFDLTNRVALVPAGAASGARLPWDSLRPAPMWPCLRGPPISWARCVTRCTRRDAAHLLYQPTWPSLTKLPRVFSAVEAEFGKLDILFNNAGTGFRKPLLEITPADWDQVADLNLRSLFFACQHGIRLMEPRGYDESSTRPRSLVPGLCPGFRVRSHERRRGAAHQGAGRRVRTERNHHQRYRPRLRLYGTHAPASKIPKLATGL